MVIYNDLNHPEVAKRIKAGEVGVLPTDTLLGLVCRAEDKTAVNKLYSLKSRENKPGTVIAADIEQLVELGIPKRYLTAVEHFWPNPISIIIPSTKELAYLDLQKGTLAVRLPADSNVNKLLLKTGPLLTSSANLSGQPPAINLAEVQKYFDKRLDFVVNNQLDYKNSQPSTIIRIIDDAVEVIREGAVKINEKGEIEK